MVTGAIGNRGVWALALSSALGMAVACGGDDDDHPPPPSTGGSSGHAGKAGAAGTTAAGTSGTGPSAGSGGASAGSGGTAGVAGGTNGGKGGAAGKGGKGGRGGKGGSGGTMTGTGGTGAEAGGGQGGGGEGGVSAEGGTSGRAGGAGTSGGGGRSGGGPGGEGGLAGEGGFGGESGLGGEGGAGPTSPNLFFSEYVENTGTNPRALEIVNKSGAAFDLSACSVGLFANAARTPTTRITLTGTVAKNDVFVLCSAAIGNVCDQISANLVFDGNDAISLRCGTTRLDVIGQTTGTSPGTQWGDASVGTADQTLRRKCSVLTGDTDGTDAFVPSSEWVSVGAGVTSGLGSATCG